MACRAFPPFCFGFLPSLSILACLIFVGRGLREARRRGLLLGGSLARRSSSSALGLPALGDRLSTVVGLGDLLLVLRSRGRLRDLPRARAWGRLDFLQRRLTLRIVNSLGLGLQLRTLAAALVGAPPRV